MKKHRGLFLALALAALVSVSAREGRAETITMTLTWTGHTLTIDYLSPFAQAGSTATALNVDTATLNSFLAANGSAYSFTDLGAKSLDFPGSTTATLSENGDAKIANSGDTVISISSVLDNFTAPTGPGTLHGTATANFLESNVGATQFSTGSFNGTVEGSKLFTSPGGTFAPPPFNGSANVGNVTAPFSLGVADTLHLHAGADAFSSQVVLTAAVPEPGTVALLSSGMLLPVAVMFLRRRRAA